MAEDTFEIKEKLTAWIRSKIPAASNLSISEMQKPGMGLSSETQLFDIIWTESGQKKRMGVVMRSAPRSRGVFPEYHLEIDFNIMRILGEHSDVPVAEMLWMEEDPSLIGVPFFLMKKLDGDVPQDYPSYHGSGMYFEATPQMRRKMWWGTIDAMSKIHKLDWRNLGLQFVGAPGPGTDPIDRRLRYWDDYLNNWCKDDPGESHPTMEATLAWLKENTYEPEHVILCWGDSRIGNTLFSRPDRNILAIMDWEMAFIGDPEADLMWSIVLDKSASRGYGLPCLEGTPTEEEVIHRYEELTGWQVKNRFYNEVLAALGFGLTMVASMKNLRSKGIPIEEEMLVNNFATQHLSKLLGLPSPGPDQYAEEKADINELTVSIQFHHTGPNEHDWYLVSNRGNVSKHQGCIESPDCTIKVSIDDWRAVLTGQLNQLEAWSTGRLVTEGDHGLLTVLGEAIAKYSMEE